MNRTLIIAALVFALGIALLRPAAKTANPQPTGSAGDS